MVLPPRCWHTQVVLEKRPLNGYFFTIWVWCRILTRFVLIDTYCLLLKDLGGSAEGDSVTVPAAQTVTRIRSVDTLRG